MRIVTKVNIALGALLGLSVLFNWGALEFTVKPSFADLEEQTARDNQERVLEALSRLQDRVRGSARDYAVWDDTYAFMHGEQPDYVDANINADALRPLNANFFAIVDNSGKVVVDLGYDFSGTEPVEARLIAPGRDRMSDTLLGAIKVSQPGAGLLETEHGLAAVGFAPVLRSDATGASPGILLIGSIIDANALRNTTKVDFRIDPASGSAGPADALVDKGDAIQVSSPLVALDGTLVGELQSITPKSITRLGQKTIWSALALIVVAGFITVRVLAALLRRIAISRIERMRSHLTQIGATGSLTAMPDDSAADELSDMALSFNSMAEQLAALRERIREQDYKEGAADHAAGILHNVRNGISPIGAIAWSMANTENATWKDQVRLALSQMQGEAPDPDRVRKLQAFVNLSVERFLAEGDQRKRELEGMQGMIRHLDEVLAADDSVSHTERAREPVKLAAAIQAAAHLVESRPSARIDVRWPQHIPDVLGSKVNLQQILGNVFINAAEAIEATERGSGHIDVAIAETKHAGQPSLDIAISDDGEGIDPVQLPRLFEKGFSTRKGRSGGLGLHWCANTLNRMGGRINAHSEGTGKGMTVHLVLPLATPAMANAA